MRQPGSPTRSGALPGRRPRREATGRRARAGIRVHPAESLAAFYPWLAAEWAPGRNNLHPDQVSRASAREVWWRCPVGHEWSTPVYQRTVSGSGCPDCYRAEAAARSKEGEARAREAREAAERAKIIQLPRRVSEDEHD